MLGMGFHSFSPCTLRPKSWFFYRIFRLRTEKWTLFDQKLQAIVWYYQNPQITYRMLHFQNIKAQRSWMVKSTVRQNGTLKECTVYTTMYATHRWYTDRMYTLVYVISAFETTHLLLQIFLSIFFFKISLQYERKPTLIHTFSILIYFMSWLLL